jgi:hypothetical protein
VLRPSSKISCGVMHGPRPALPGGPSTTVPRGITRHARAPRTDHRLPTPTQHPDLVSQAGGPRANGLDERTRRADRREAQVDIDVAEPVPETRLIPEVSAVEDDVTEVNSDRGDADDEDDIEEAAEASSASASGAQTGSAV